MGEVLPKVLNPADFYACPRLLATRRACLPARSPPARRLTYPPTKSSVMNAMATFFNRRTLRRVRGGASERAVPIAKILPTRPNADTDDCVQVLPIARAPGSRHPPRSPRLTIRG